MFIRWGVVGGLAIAWMVQAAPPARAAGEGAAVQLQVRDNIATMSNGIVTVNVDLSAAQIESIHYRGHEMVNNTGRHRNIYFSRDGGADYEQLPHCIGSVVSRSADMAEVSARHVYEPGKDKHAWDVEVRFILRRGMSGLYVMAETSHPASYPKMGIGEWRMVWSTPETARDVLPNIYVDELRHWRAPTPAEMSHDEPVPGAPKEVTKVTTGPWAGRLDCKYEYAARYWHLGCWGFASDESGNGAWVVFGSHEFFNDGPNKQDLTAAVGTTLIHLNMNHYDGSGIEVPAGQEWHKCYGPWLLYVNHEASADACWHDAQQQAKKEQAAWPYAWLKQPDYPLAEQRGSVSGRLVVRDALKPDLPVKGAWVGLAQPGEEYKTDFQFQGRAYQFWTQAAADGSFTIPAVRDGSYALYAYVTGENGELQKTDVTVKAGEPTALGDVVWNVPRHGTKLGWEIGTPDRVADGFAHSKDYYLPLMYEKLWTEVPDPLDYTVGKSDPEKDWYYAQTRHETRGGSTPGFEPAKWRIHFTLNEQPRGAATLVLGIAGADRARLGVFMNNESRELTEVEPPVQGGNGLIREANHTKYSVVDVSIPAGRLRMGENTITLVQQSVREPSSYVMYDSVSLELP